jgi:transcriptional regulator with XRE-family HTH domain
VSNKRKIKPLDTGDQIKKLGERIRQLRKDAGYSNAEDFAYENSIPRSAYGRYEQGKNIEFTTLIRIVNCHGITLKEFFSEGFG